MSIHIEANKDQIADSILLPGDPLRAKYIAEKFLTNLLCYNNIRGMLGYTGEYKGQRISVQGTGMGIPSLSIYVYELLHDYGVKNLIRVGTCGGIQSELNLKDIILAMGSCTDSNINRLTFNGDFAPIADFNLLNTAFNISKEKNIDVKVGNIFATDRFYHSDKNYLHKWTQHNVLGIDMECSGLFTLAAAANARALGILTVSDQLISNQHLTSQEKEQSLDIMSELALDTIVNMKNKGF